MINSTVTATGVYVDDDGHPPARTELHPVDLVIGPVTRSLISGDDWIAKRAADSGVRVGASLFAYRYAAASDTRKGLFSRVRLAPTLREAPPSCSLFRRDRGLSLNGLPFLATVSRSVRTPLGARGGS
jgi:hypothetical protein